MKNFKFLIILFCTIFLCSFDNQYQTEYKSLQDINFAYKSERNIVIRHQEQVWEIDYTIYNQDYQFSYFIDSNIIPMSMKVFEFAGKNQMIFNECVSKEHLEIYQVSQNTLNDRSRFDGWQEQNKGVSTVWGLYDPRLGEKIFASIMITDHTLEENNLIFAHELAHYWYDRFCWNQSWLSSDEQFAIEFEKFYLKQENY